MAQTIKNPPANAGDLGLIPGLRGSLKEGNGYPLQYFCLENPMDRRAWQAPVHSITNIFNELHSTSALHWEMIHYESSFPLSLIFFLLFIVLWFLQSQLFWNVCSIEPDQTDLDLNFGLSRVHNRKGFWLLMNEFQLTNAEIIATGVYLLKKYISTVSDYVRDSTCSFSVLVFTLLI